MAAPAWVQNRGSISNPPLLPTGITVGNLLVMTVWLTSSGTTGTLNTPAGWTSVVDGSTLFGFSSRCRLYVFAKIAAAGETAPTFTSAGGPISSFQTEVSEISGAAFPLVGVGGVTSAGTSVAVPAITTPNIDNLVFYVLGSNTDYDEVTAYPAGSTGRVHHQDATVGSYVAIGTKAQAVAGVVAASSFTRNQTQFPAIAHTVAIPPVVSSGAAAKIKFGTNLAVTDEGSNVIRVDAAATDISGKVDRDAVEAATNRLVAVKLAAADALPAFRILGNGQQEWGPGGAAAPDTFLRRNGANWLITGGRLDAAGMLVANTGVAGQILAGNVFSDGRPTLLFGTEGDTYLRRNGTNWLAASGRLDAAGTVVAASGLAAQVMAGDVFADGRPLLLFGSAGDTAVYRAGASQVGMSFPGGIGNRAVEVGAPDSGGTGFRMVRIAN